MNETKEPNFFIMKHRKHVCSLSASQSSVQLDLLVLFTPTLQLQEGIMLEIQVESIGIFFDNT